MIALIAHDAKKQELLEFVRAHIDAFRGRSLVATGHTAALLSAELGLDIEAIEHGPRGGDLVIGGRLDRPYNLVVRQ